MSERPAKSAKPELLAPAGGHEAYLAAVANGADAVYLGLKELNARRGAVNFTLDELADVTRHAHLRGRRVYLTANILTMTEEMPAALETVDAAWAAGVDAVIVQDLGLIRLVRSELPDVRVHASTQIDAHNTASVLALSALGASRVTLARETALAEIETMGASGVELESFVHGSLCFCYSGQCLMSSMIGGRSANRGLCAQPCRLRYRLVDGAGAEAACPGPYLLSPRDLAGITVLPQLAHAGVAALKIEGRMKSAEYVALVTGVYRAALDRAWEDAKGFAVTPGEWATLQEAFSRGFTEGSLTGRRGEERMSYQRPNNRGVPIGRLTRVGAGDATLALDAALDADDVVEVWTRRGRFAQRVGTMTLRGVVSPHAPAGSRPELVLVKQASPGDRVFRVANASLLDAARRTWTQARPTVPLDVGVRIRVGEPLAVTVTAAGHSASAEGPVVETARTKRVTAEEVMEHVGRLGGTPYFADAWSIDLDSAAGVAFSALHAARRDAVEALDASRLAAWNGRLSGRVKAPSASSAPRAAGAQPSLVAAVVSAEAAQACLAAGADSAFVAVSAAEPTPQMPDGAAPLLGRIAHDAEVGSLLATARHAGRGVTGNLGLLRLLAEAGIGAEADWGLNVVNPWAAEALADLGATFVWASPELSGRHLAALAGSSPVPVGAVVFGRLELMVAEHCVLSAAGPCGRQCADCPRRGQPFTLRDQKDYAFPVSTDAAGRSHIYNSVTLDLSRSVVELVEAGVAGLRLELETATPSEAVEYTRAWRTLLDDALAGRPAPASPLVQPATTGHFYRGLR